MLRSRETFNTKSHLMNTKMTLDEPGRATSSDVLPIPSDVPDAFTEHFSTIPPKLASEITSPANGHNSCFEHLNITDKVSF